VRLSNAEGTTALHVGSAHLAVHGKGPSIVSGSDRRLTFGGSPDVVIPPGALAVSDPVPLSVPASSDLSVSLYLPDSVVATTEHSLGQTTYISSSGDFSGADTLDSPKTTDSWYFLAGIEVEGSSNAHAIVALGDSITDGMKSTMDANHRWPDFLAERLNATRRASPRAVVNEGISGNCVLRELVGASALVRLDRDVLAQPGVKYLIVLEGTNDIGATVTAPEQAATVDQIIAGYRQIILRAHARGLKVFGGTLPPFEGMSFPGFSSTPAADAKREAVNMWIRTSGAYDAVIDFDRATRDPAHPSRLLPAFDSGDHGHPNDAGYKAMADAIDLSLFNDAPP
jgi:lysophospholipase L1-like esterase